METLSERYDLSRSTAYYWLDRFEALSIKEAIEETTAPNNRPERPPALTAEERDEPRADLATPGRTFDFDAESWSTETVRDRIENR